MSNINVNLEPCPISTSHTHGPDSLCIGRPVLIPCPVPRTVTFEVQLGECAGCGSPGESLAGHDAMCPARSVRVSCSIGGDGTWVGSEVFTADNSDRHDGLFPAHLRIDVVLAACRERWALVKALVTGKPFIPNNWDGPASVMALFTQRDAVFAALAAMARAEMAALRAQYRADEAFPSARFAKPGDADHRALGPSVNRLARFVEYLVEKVGVL